MWQVFNFMTRCILTRAAMFSCTNQVSRVYEKDLGHVKTGFELGACLKSLSSEI